MPHAIRANDHAALPNLASLLQVMWGLSPTGPFTNTVTGYSRAYIQARPELWWLQSKKFLA
jgi:hypothetical protein